MPSQHRQQGKTLARRTNGAGELALVRRLRARSARLAASSKDLVLGIGDDCAILRPGTAEDIIVTTDFSLEGRHFRRDWHPAASAGHRTLARGLSDLAAMGGRPLAAFLSLALPRAIAEDRVWVDQYLRGLLALAEQAKIPLAGGDTSEAAGEEILADIVCLGAVPRGRALRRDGASPGDRIWVTGTLGGAAAELASLGGKPLPPSKRSMTRHRSRHPQLFPVPRLATGQHLLRRGLATAAIDISDGLSTDLTHLCEASGVAAEIREVSLPLDALLEQKPAEEALALALHGGEDYELLFTAPEDLRLPRTIGGVPVTDIGQIIPARPRRPKVTLINRQGERQRLRPAGWEHFR